MMTFEEELTNAITEYSRNTYQSWEFDVRDHIMPIIDKWTFRKPTFEDGEPVQFGDTVKFEDRVFDVDEVRYGVDNTVLMQNWEDEEGGIWRFNDWEHVEHPKPKQVLAADGLPLEVGQTVYMVGDSELAIAGSEAVVQGFEDGYVIIWNGEVVKPEWLTHTKPVFDADGVIINEGDTVYWIGKSNILGSYGDEKVVRKVHEDGTVTFERGGTGLAKYVSHNRPDTLERIREDASENGIAYCSRRGMYDKGMTLGECMAAMTLDLIDRTVKVMERGK